MDEHKQLLEQNKTICIAPFNALYIKRVAETGDVKYTCCCNIKPQDSADAFVEIQNSIKQGKPVAACERCYKDEAKGGYSERMRHFDGLDPRTYDQFINQNFFVDHFQLQVKLSSRCPLACRSCAPGESSGYAALGVNNYAVSPLNSVDFSADTTYNKQIKDIIVDLYENCPAPCLHLMGGEILVQSGWGDFLTWMVDNNYAHKFILMFTTALASNIPKWLLDSIPHFGSVVAEYSIDSTGDNYEYLRWPAKFDKVDSNVDTMNKALQSVHHRTSIAIVVSINNIMYLDDLLDYCGSKNATVEPHHLIDPPHLAPEILPNPYRQHAQDAVGRALTHSIFDTGNQDMLKNFLTTLYNALDNQQLINQTLFDKYLQQSAVFDTKTKMSTKVQNKRLWDLLSDTHKERYENLI